jgi:hypothetical protein
MHALGGRLAGHPRRTYLVDLWRWVGSGCPWPDQGACARGATLVVMDLSPFRIERFYARYEHSTRFMLSSSDCQSRTIAELLELEPDARERLLECWCGYNRVAGRARASPGDCLAVRADRHRGGGRHLVR